MTYARIQDGIVMEIIDDVKNTDGNIVPISERFTREVADTLYDITGVLPQPDQRWIFDGTNFSEPKQPVVDYVSLNKSIKNSLLTMASFAMAPLQDAIDLDEATDEEKSKITEWKKYRVAVNRMDVNNASPVWPVKPE